MGKYMKKSKVGVTGMDVSQYSLGVLTRARKLDLQRKQQEAAKSSPPSTMSNFESCYIQLRNRRLQKPLLFAQKKNWSKSPNKTTSSRPEKDNVLLVIATDETEDSNDFTREGSFAENTVDEGRERTTRESTPCSFVNSETPGSTTRPISSRAAIQRNFPTSHEIEEFFAFAEQEHQKLFTEKYNFDFMNDFPLQGRYEWLMVEL